jgi:FSR family fosmidomycin resistance protein-like MFS transporter
LSAGHVATDIAQGAVPALLVYLQPELGLSYTQTAAVIVVLTVSSSLMQPAFGWWSDRRGTRARWPLAASLLVGGTCIALAATAPGYSLLLLLVGVGGIGIGAFHPEASRIAYLASGYRQATGMAVFSTAGNVGFALGPLLVAVAVGAFDLEGGLLIAIPCFAAAAYLFLNRTLLTAQLARLPRAVAHRGHDQPRALALLVTICVLRNVGFYGLITFVPLSEVASGHSRSESARLLAYLLAAGALSALAAGPVADRVGRRPVILVSLVTSVASLLVYVLIDGWVGKAAALIAGAAIISTFSVTVVLGQEYLPSRIALAAALAGGFAFGLGACAAVIVGAIADLVDVRTALLVCACGPALAAVLTVLLPRVERPPRRVPVASAV